MTVDRLAICLTVAMLVPMPPVALEQVEVLVTRSDGRPVEGLQAGDFVVRAGNVRLPILAFERAPLPTTGILLVDASASVRLWQAFLDSVRRDFLPGLEVSDELMPAAFAEHVRLGETFSSTPDIIERDLRQMLTTAGDQPSRIWDAIDAAVGVLSAKPGHRVIFLVTDGRASGNVEGLDAVAARAVKERVAICTIALAPLVQSRTKAGLSSTDPNQFLAWLSAVTGGVYINDVNGLVTVQPSKGLDGLLRSMRPARIGGALAHAYAAMRSRYVIGFDREGIDHDAPLIVGVTQKSLRVHARQWLR